MNSNYGRGVEVITTLQPAPRKTAVSSFYQTYQLNPSPLILSSTITPKAIMPEFWNGDRTIRNSQLPLIEDGKIAGAMGAPRRGSSRRVARRQYSLPETGSKQVPTNSRTTIRMSQSTEFGNNSGVPSNRRKLSLQEVRVKHVHFSENITTSDGINSRDKSESSHSKDFPGSNQVTKPNNQGELGNINSTNRMLTRRNKSASDTRGSHQKVGSANAASDQAWQKDRINEEIIATRDDKKVIPTPATEKSSNNNTQEPKKGSRVVVCNSAAVNYCDNVKTSRIVAWLEEVNEATNITEKLRSKSSLAYFDS